ncbi:MAG TPA: SusD/RagB family nutrient-binding outer membrane lipoprotein, partial [Daejeonella sp.]|nr:SusD/RagB family nutrient-binding outer membrane lipoprotein [Daejeonella sp.]
MAYIKKIACLLLLSTVITSSCTKDFEELNTDPNRLDRVSPGTLLNPVIYSMASFNAQRSTDFTFNLMQVSVPYPSVAGGIHQYDVSESAGNSTWNTYYKWIKNLKEMKTAADEVNDPNYQAIALTLNAWTYSLLSDGFGDVPMNEAASGDEGILRPAFDTQKDVYTKILNDLNTANSLFNPGKSLIYGSEILYGNSVSNWQKFNNSLYLRLLLRVSKRQEMNPVAKMV